MISTGFFREALADELKADPGFAAAASDVAPIIVLQGLVTEQGTGRRASRVQIYGVDDRFWAFHGIAGRSGPAGRDAFVSRALAADIGAADGGTILVRVERPSAIPIESLHGQKEDPGRTIRLTVRGILDRSEGGEFSIRPQQGDVRAVFVPLRRLQQDLDQPSRVNALLISDGAATTGTVRCRRRSGRWRRSRTSGCRCARSSRRTRSRSKRRRDSSTRRARPRRCRPPQGPGLEAHPVLTYLANTLRAGDRQVPYSLVTAMDLSMVAPGLTARALRRRPIRRPPSAIQS